jgi:hypothetical protein
MTVQSWAELHSDVDEYTAMCEEISTWIFEPGFLNLDFLPVLKSTRCFKSTDMQVPSITCSQLIAILSLLAAQGQLQRCASVVALWAKVTDRHKLIEVRCSSSSSSSSSGSSRSTTYTGSVAFEVQHCGAAAGAILEAS